jgi:hypothetical protein
MTGYHKIGIIHLDMVRSLGRVQSRLPILVNIIAHAVLIYLLSDMWSLV